MTGEAPVVVAVAQFEDRYNSTERASFSSKTSTYMLKGTNRRNVEAHDRLDSGKVSRSRRTIMLELDLLSICTFVSRECTPSPPNGYARFARNYCNELPACYPSPSAPSQYCKCPTIQTLKRQNPIFSDM